MLAKFKNKIDSDILHVGLITLIVILEALQIIVTVGFFLTLGSPKHISLDLFLPEQFVMVAPEWDTLICRIFVLSAIALQVFFIACFYRKLSSSSLSERKFLLNFLAGEMACVFLLFYVIFKMAVYGYPVSLKKLLLDLLILVWMAKGGYVVFRNRRMEFFNSFKGMFLRTPVRRLSEMGVVLFIISVIYIPDVGGAVARIFCNDQFYHFDSFIAAPVWGYHHGVDVFSQYGVGLPVIVAKLCELLGGVNYENILRIFIWQSIIYYGVLYGFIRSWLKNVPLAILGVLLAIKFQMFYYETNATFIWHTPSGSAVRYFGDVFFFLCLWRWLETRKSQYWLLALLVVGGALFYITDAGIYAWVSLCAFLILMWFCPSLRSWLRERKGRVVGWGCSFVMPWAVAFFLCWSVYPGRMGIFGGKVNILEHIELVAFDMGALPMFSGFETKSFFPLWVGLLQAPFFVYTLIFVLTLIVLNKIGEKNILAVVVAVYALCLYHYFVFRSAPVSHHVLGTPVALLVCYWLDKLTRSLSPVTRQKFIFLSLVTVIFCLITSHIFLRYPNVWNQGRFSLANEVKAVQRKQLDIGADAAFISSLTRRDEEVCLVSSFEVPLLMAADRRPFFYYFPLLNSRPPTMRVFGGTRLVTQKQLAQVMRQLAEKSPRLIFIEKKLVDGRLPKIYYEYYLALKLLVNYIRANYEPVQQGQYLLAMKKLSN